MSTAAVSAAQAIGEQLQSPDDLTKIAAFRKKLEKEKASIDARLKTGIKEQLDATREGLRKLFDTRNNIQAIKDELTSLDKECKDPKNVVATFDQISRVSCSTLPCFLSFLCLRPSLGLYGSPQLRANRGNGEQFARNE
jgi:exocyst complex component 3